MKTENGLIQFMQKFPDDDACRSYLEGAAVAEWSGLSALFRWQTLLSD